MRVRRLGPYARTTDTPGERARRVRAVQLVQHLAEPRPDVVPDAADHEVADVLRERSNKRGCGADYKRLRICEAVQDERPGMVHGRE